MEKVCFVYVKVCKQTRNCTDIFQGPIKTLRMEVFKLLREEQQQEAQDFISAPNYIKQ